MVPNLFDRFGGVRPMAAALGEKPSTVQSWKTTGRVPSIKQPEVLEKASQLGIRITAQDVVFPLDRRPSILADTMTHPYRTPDASVDCDPHSVSQRSRIA